MSDWARLLVARERPHTSRQAGYQRGSIVCVCVDLWWPIWKPQAAIWVSHKGNGRKRMLGKQANSKQDQIPFRSHSSVAILLLLLLLLGLVPGSSNSILAFGSYYLGFFNQTSASSKKNILCFWSERQRSISISFTSFLGCNCVCHELNTK